MLTLRRFTALADSYGADLRRWPEREREAAAALLAASPDARAILDAARTLDEAIAEGVPLGRRDASDAALARLRAGVAARIAPLPARRRPEVGGWAKVAGGAFPLLPDLRWVGLATAGGFAIAAGLLIGATYVSAPPAEDVLTMLQPAPLHALVD